LASAGQCAYASRQRYPDTSASTVVSLFPPPDGKAHLHGRSRHSRHFAWHDWGSGAWHLVLSYHARRLLAASGRRCSGPRSWASTAPSSALLLTHRLSRPLLTLLLSLRLLHRLSLFSELLLLVKPDMSLDVLGIFVLP